MAGSFPKRLAVRLVRILRQMVWPASDGEREIGQRRRMCAKKPTPELEVTCSVQPKAMRVTNGVRQLAPQVYRDDAFGQTHSKHPRAWRQSHLLAQLVHIECRLDSAIQFRKKRGCFELSQRALK